MKQEVEKEKTKKRIYYLDILRVIACLTVIMIHTSATYVVRNFGTFNFGLVICLIVYLGLLFHYLL